MYVCLVYLYVYVIMRDRLRNGNVCSLVLFVVIAFRTAIYGNFSEASLRSVAPRPCYRSNHSLTLCHSGDQSESHEDTLAYQDTLHSSSRILGSFLKTDNTKNSSGGFTWTSHAQGGGFRAPRSVSSGFSGFTKSAGLAVSREGSGIPTGSPEEDVVNRGSWKREGRELRIHCVRSALRIKDGGRCDKRLDHPGRVGRGLGSVWVGAIRNRISVCATVCAKGCGGRGRRIFSDVLLLSIC